MKILAILLSFLILTLVETPCSDKGSHDQTEKSIESETTNEQEEDNCNTFCIFQCVCPITLCASINELIDFEKQQEFDTRRESNYNDDWVFKDEYLPHYSSLYLCGQI